VKFLHLHLQNFVAIPDNCDRAFASDREFLSSSFWRCRLLLFTIGAIATIATSLPGRVSAEISQVDTDRVCASQLEAEINKIALMPKLRTSRLGIFITTLSQPLQILANLDGDKYFIPASNAKLFTTAAVLRLLGTNYRIRTSLVAQRSPDAAGEIAGGLWVVGRGDPSFTTDSLKALVKQLVQKGVKRVKGGIHAAPIFSDSGLGLGWEWQDLQEDYAAIAHALTINENVLDWTIKPFQVGQPVDFSWDSPGLASGWIVENQAKTGIKGIKNTLKLERPLNSQRLIISGQIPQDAEPELGATAVPNPSAHFLKLLTAELIAQGIQTDPELASPDRISKRQSGLPQVELAAVASPTVAELVRTTDKDSNNLYAELLLRQLGQRSSHTQMDAGESGLQAVTAFAQKLGIATDSFNLADASGLSRRNAIAPRAFVQLLQVMNGDRVFKDSLPIAAVDGTLKNRFKHTAAQANLTAKTGTLSDAVSLSGYVTPAAYDELVFSVLLNNSNLSAKDAREIVDAIALLLTRVKRC
jgi:D-alanyl-D-alanine carboxypeptidase/D-alanyl-D-alanine-endopeptidase (penicillin-binding protein 4)